MEIKVQKSNKVTKAVIACGGYSTRFMPISKAVPKEMLPIYDKPVIHYIMEELQCAGITDVLLLVGRGREMLLNYFDRNLEIEDVMAKKVGREKAEEVLNPFANMNIQYRRVAIPRGTADNIWHAKSFVGDEPFMMMYSDDVFFADNQGGFGGNVTSEMIAMYGCGDMSPAQNLVACVPVAPEHAHKYGIIKPGVHASDGCYIGNILDVHEIVEKPKTNTCHTPMAVVGRFILSPKIIELIDERKIKNEEREICLMDVINEVAKSGEVSAWRTAAKRFDTGTPEGLIKAGNYVADK